jgi:hypothetical protein
VCDDLEIELQLVFYLHGASGDGNGSDAELGLLELGGTRVRPAVFFHRDGDGMSLAMEGEVTSDVPGTLP